MTRPAHVPPGTACRTGRHGHHDVYDPDCPCRDLLDVLASKWAALIIGALTDGPVRFGELQRQIGPVTAKSLTKTLRRLEDYGLVERRIYAAVPPRVDYALTATGHSAAVPLAALRMGRATPRLHRWRAWLTSAARGEGHWYPRG